MQLSPNSQIPVSYTTSLPGDVTLYFVQAVLRDTQSGKTLQTLNLTNVSSTPNRYQGLFNPVSDPSGLGRAVDITISVYTDSGHTTLSNNYQILQLNYTILQPWIQNLGTGGGMNIDYVKLQNMFDGSKVNNSEMGNELVKKISKNEIDYDRIGDMLDEKIETTRSSLSSEFGKHTDNLSKRVNDSLESVTQLHANHSKSISNVENKIQALERKISDGQSISSKEIKEIKSVLSDVGSSVISEAKSTMQDSTDTHQKTINDTIKKAITEFQEYLKDNLSEKEIKMVYNMAPEKREKEKQRGYAPEDILSLLR